MSDSEDMANPLPPLFSLQERADGTGFHVCCCNLFILGFARVRFSESPSKFSLSYLLSNSCLMLFSALGFLSLCEKPDFLELESSSGPF